MVCLNLHFIHVLWEDPWGVCGRKWDSRTHPSVDLQSFWGCRLCAGRLCPKPCGRQHTWVQVSPELPASVSPLAAGLRAGLGLFLTVPAAGAGRVALLNPAVAT